LERIWRRAAESDGEPQVVVLLAESGMGKTRLAQEFFVHLSTTLDGTGEAGYWPDVLEQVGDNLRVNPAEQDCRPDRLPPFLWWGLRFVDAGERNVVNAAMDADLPALASHLAVLLAGVRDRGRLREVLKTLGDAGLDVALDVAGGGLVKTAATTLRKLWGIGQEFLADRPAASLDAARQREQASKAERVVAGLGAVLAAREDRLPICVFVDDGHFAGADPESVDLLKRLLDAARAGRWPLLAGELQSPLRPGRRAAASRGHRFFRPSGEFRPRDARHPDTALHPASSGASLKPPSARICARCCAAASGRLTRTGHSTMPSRRQIRVSRSRPISKPARSARASFTTAIAA
jgi:hypothetical protein